MNVSVTAAVGAIIVALLTSAISGYVTLRNATKATGPANSQAQLAWVKQAQDEATQAKADAREAKLDAATAERRMREQDRRLDETERRVLHLDGVTHDLISWIERVIRAKDQIDPNLPNDPATLRLIAVINGGPASMSSARLRTDP